MSEPDLQQWVGNEEHAEEVLYPAPAKALAQTLNQNDFHADADLPPLWYWLYFLPLVRMSDVGVDGHPKRGGFLPPVPLERRMWAGSEIHFTDNALRIGEPASKTSRVVSVQEKSGKSGPLVFVTVQHTLANARGTAVEETQNIVYLPMPERFAPPPPNPLPDDLAWQESMDVDPVLLFRFSALTFNGHRIHYDRPYAMETEKYPGLVVHGPLQALALLDAARRYNPGASLKSYRFRGTRPLFDFDELTLCGGSMAGKEQALFTANTEGQVATQATAVWG